jgi:hypothetical protein
MGGLRAGQSEIAAWSWLRDVMPSLGKIRYRWALLSWLREGYVAVGWWGVAKLGS